MHLKIKRILIPTLLAGLFFISSYFSSAGQAITNTTYLPLVSLNMTGWIGPYGGYITTIIIDRFNPQVVYAGTWGAGVFKTQESGQKWLPVNFGLGNLLINSMAIDPKNTSTLYAGTYKNQIYKSTDGGNSWIWSGTGMQDQAIVYSIAINPGNPNYVYASTRGISNNGAPPWNGVVYRSTNAGQSWDPILLNVGGEAAQDWVYSLTVSPNDSKNVYAASHEHGPYFSPNYGDNWYPLQNGIQDLSGRAIIVNPVHYDDSMLYYGVWHTDAVYKSYNQGNNWIPANSGIKYAKVTSIIISPENSDSVYLATSNRGLLNSQDGGYHWHDAGLQTDHISSLSINPAHPGILYAGTAGDGLQKSTYYGIDWQPANSGIDNAMTTSIILSPSNPKSLFTSLYGAGVFQSNNRGSIWSEMNAGLMDKFVHALVQDPAQPGVIYALTDTAGLFKNDTNNGNGWVRVGQGLPLAQDSQPAYPEDHPFATREMQDVDTNPEPDLSIIQIVSDNLLTMTFAPSAPQIAFMGTGGSGVYKSVDGALTWSFAGLSGESVQSLAVDPADSNLLYAALAAPGSLKISLDGGNIWTDANLSVTIYCLATSPSMPGILFAGTNNGLYQYEAGFWSPLALAGQEVTAITIDPLHTERIFAGTSSNGALYSNDAGSSWTPVDQKLDGHTIQSINFDPVLPNYIYFATKTHGIYLLTKSFK